MKTRFFISFVVALLGGIAGSLLATREGDSSREIKDVEQRLESKFKPQVLFDRAIPASTTYKTYEVIAPGGRVLEIQLDRFPVEGELEALFAQLVSGERPIKPPQALVGRVGTITQSTPAWSEVEMLWSSLTWDNQQVAKAKAMLRWPAKPVETESYAWESRLTQAAQPWRVEEPGRLWWRRIGLAAGGAIGGFILAIVALAILVWSWAFLLARIRELSGAFRGKQS